MTNNVIATRVLLICSGALTGFIYYLIVDAEILNGLPAGLQRLIIYFALGFFPALGILAGKATLMRTGLAAALPSMLAALMATWAGMRFDIASSRISTLIDPSHEGMLLIPFLVLTAFMLPFALMLATNRQNWRDHGALFDLAWNAAIKALIALLFVLLFWALYFLSDELLGIVNVDLLGDLLRIDPVGPVLTGIVVGAALATLGEIEAVLIIGRTLLMRLLRLLLPPITAVVVLFAMAALFQGLDRTFHRLSAATTMIGIALGAIALIAATLDRDDETAARSPVFLWSARIMACVLPVVAGLAIYATWLRIEQHGLTPARLAALTLGWAVLAYALWYALVALFGGRGWQDQIRRANVTLAIGAIALLALWLSPVLNAHRLSAEDQLTRLESGESLPDPTTFRAFERWGIAGSEALATIDNWRGNPEHSLIIAELDIHHSTGTPEQSARELYEKLAREAPTFPAGRKPPAPGASDFTDASADLHKLRSVLSYCKLTETGGGCAILAHGLLLDQDEDQQAILLGWDGKGRVLGYLLQPSLSPGGENGSWINWSLVQLRIDPPGWQIQDRPTATDTLLKDLQAGEYSIAPPRHLELKIGPYRFHPNP